MIKTKHQNASFILSSSRPKDGRAFLNWQLIDIGLRFASFANPKYRRSCSLQQAKYESVLIMSCYKNT